MARGGASVAQVKAAVAELERDGVERYQIDPVAHVAYHAGQDLLSAGQPELAARLYGKFEAQLLDWLKPGDPDNARIRALVRSQGKVNSFQSYLHL
jgi:hypothetical protein